ncbi:4'-phosphopantetheinyl transferase family protein [Allomuricauda sp. SCSIO 65647]|uniref:4'-phosphopantetheinyl transferase family protein n=1 Tax=Allomuricauda sp. SCSIO 65647 TaxID=2908843 RepID=UPI001F1E79DD|nr:4'-phosphopantetheinyl transferase family protein [Muricauda sp. SCSIO 65647]UJH66143.1 4'-phosphopantetheinyl transferase superfamily protein [Muricauda sp. SCSIO 65647]
MPLYKTITESNNTKIYIWKVTESEADLSKEVVLTAHCQDRVVAMKSEMHRRAFLSIRHLMALSSYEDKDLYYDEMGKPHLRDGNHISITHSHEFTAIIVSKSQKVGVDIEKQRDKILKIAHKFTPIEEYRTLANTGAIIRKLTIVWGAKESLYKIYAQNGLSFLRHIDVHDFSFQEGSTTAEILYKGELSQYAVKFLEFEGFTCVYALKKEED